MGNILLEAIHELREDKDLKEDLDTLYNDLSDEEIDKWTKDCQSSLNRFIDKELEFQVAGGGEGSDAWYEDGFGKITEIRDDGDSLYIRVKADNDKNPVISDAFISYKEFGLSEDSNPKEILDRWESLTLEELSNIAYEQLSENAGK